MNLLRRGTLRAALWSAAIFAAVGCTGWPSQAKQPPAAPPLVKAQVAPDELPTVVDPPSTSSIRHDTKAFTQGLLYHAGFLYEGTGRNGKSKVRQIDPETGSVEKEVPIEDQHFGEGLAFLDGHFYQLTWTSGVCLVYSEQLEFQKQILYGTEGWGLTVDKEKKLLIFSDGTAEIRFVDPETFITKRKFTVTDGNGDPVYRLNELEWVRGEIWANVWMSDAICRIDPAEGKVVGWIKLSRLVRENQTGNDDVLNGIAYDPDTDTLWLTGKLWPKIYRFEEVEKLFFSVTHPDTPRSGTPSPVH